MSRKNVIIIRENFDFNGRLKSIWQYIDRSEKPGYYARISKCCLVLTTLFCIAIMIALIAGFVLIFFARQPGLYGEDCLHRSCWKGLSLKCINNTCLCESNQYYMIGCHEKKNYYEKCYGNTSYCVENLNMQCIDGVCKCNSSNSYWIDGKCIDYQSYNNPCTTTLCSIRAMLTCDSSRKICLCDNTRLF